MKITTRCGQAAVDGLNEALLAKAVEAKVLKTNRVRADTTVVEANVAYPSDSWLLAKGVAKMATLGQEAAGDGVGDAHHGWPTGRARCGRGPGRSTPTCGAATTTSSPRSRRINAELAGIAERVAGQADAVVRNARRKLRTSATGVGAGPCGGRRVGTHRRVDPQDRRADPPTPRR